MKDTPTTRLLLAASVLVLVGGCAAALRIGAGGLGRGMAVGAGARIGVAVGARTALTHGALRSMLGEVTAAGRAPAVLSITRSGAVVHRGRVLAAIESDGHLIARQGGSEYVLGRLTQNRVWGFTESGGTVAVGRLRGFIPSRGVAIRSGPSASAPRVEILRGDVTAEVLQVRDGWFEIRLPNQSTGWVWGALVALAVIVDDDEDDEEEPADSGLADAGENVLIVLQNGQSLRARTYARHGGALHVWDQEGRHYVFGENLVSDCVPLDELPQAQDTPLVELANGAVIIGTPHLLETGAVAIDSPEGSTIFVDAALVNNPPAPGEAVAEY